MWGVRLLPMFCPRRCDFVCLPGVAIGLSHSLRKHVAAHEKSPMIGVGITLSAQSHVSCLSVKYCDLMRSIPTGCTLLLQGLLLGNCAGGVGHCSHVCERQARPRHRAPRGRQPGEGLALHERDCIICFEYRMAYAAALSAPRTPEGFRALQ